ncbi:homocysteine S-methyltransferase [Lacisediminihabitans profunda]|uniref:Homocysteine S-methyltransferase n=1 Tax=Lacisediminihabitans profunda TaxID=2594790 RepID=A0A5C8US05_9MICO|nr:homocysteine S-methyltransferase [Lacisediminihabitans profunda]TXN30366.1 homocysteine S-methyltransferase [Lacisediminihabitans profunda]
MTSFAAALARGGVVLDGGLGTLLESRGNDLSSTLWSARLLLENPAEIRDAHAEYFRAGADVAITASYQVSYEALARRGHAGAAADAVLRSSVRLAIEARDATREEAHGRPAWVAASVGPYGAMLADGSEYSGDYGLTVPQLRQWHRRRIQVLAASAADLLAVETIPSLAEAEAVALEIAGTGKPAWISLTSAFGALRSGDSLVEAYRIASDPAEVVAVGVNCTDPHDVATAIAAARQVTDKPVIVYPNSGEQWDAKNRRWMGSAEFPHELVREWIAAGAAAVGGCCRVGPTQVAAIAATVRG